MYVMFVLIGFSLLVALIFLGVFIWAVRSGQYEDHYTPSVRMLFDDEKKPADSGTPADDDNEQSSKPDTQELRSTD
ncbi:MAG: cbb3-type cytochrome oxidase assembly protein CcoS [Bacteroidetes bacterium]|nr:cbb3-type cytochrome oxidase assembly protein CcoS [Bacteroidota bacterium]